MSEDDPHDDIERLEAQIDEIGGRLDSCRKFILAARIAIAAGGALLAAMLLGIVTPDPRLLFAAIAAILGGLVVWGSNSSTANEAATELAAAEAERAELIGRLDLHLIETRKTLH